MADDLEVFQYLRVSSKLSRSPTPKPRVTEMYNDLPLARPTPSQFCIASEYPFSLFPRAEEQGMLKAAGDHVVPPAEEANEGTKLLPSEARIPNCLFTNAYFERTGLLLVYH